MKPIREVIDNFSDGLNTLVSARDLLNSQFQELKLWVIRLKGQLTKQKGDDAYIGSGLGITNVSASATTLVNGRGFHIYRTSKNAGGSDVGTEWGVYYLKGSSTSLLYRNSLFPKISTVDNTGLTTFSTLDLFPTKTNVAPDFYSQNEILRISDSYFANTTNKSLWYGHIKRDILGKNEDYTKSPTFESPSSANGVSNTDINDWVLDTQKGDTPTVVKMGGFGDADGVLDTIGQVGLFIYDPRSQIDINLETDNDQVSFESDAWEQWGQAVEAPEGDTFNKEDRWTATFVYDHVYESELGRGQSSTDIGVSGFNTVESDPEIEDDNKVYSYEDSNALTELVTQADYDADANIISIGKEGTAANAEAVNFTVGDIIRINDEYMKIYQTSPPPSSGTNGLYVIRGVFNSKIPSSHPKSSKIYRVRSRQCARAVNLVLYTGDDIDNASGFNKRITAVNVYWKPKNEVDWYLVESYDINEGATMNKIPFKEALKQNNKGSYGWYGSEEYKSFFDSTGRWMLCPDETQLINDKPQVTHASAVVSGTSLLDLNLNKFTTTWDNTGGHYCFTSPFTLGTEHDELDRDSSYSNIRNAICTNIAHIQYVHSDGKAIYNGASLFCEKDSVDLTKTQWQNIATAAGDYATITFAAPDVGSTATSDGDFNNPLELGFKAGQRLHVCPVEGFPDSANLGKYVIHAVTSTTITVKDTDALTAAGYTAGEFLSNFDDNVTSNEISVFLIAASGVNHYNYRYASVFDNDETVIPDKLNIETLIPDTIGEVNDSSPDEDNKNHRHVSVYAFRDDAVTTMYVPYYGDKDLTYAGLTGRSESTRIRDVRWKCSTVINNMAVIGNIRTTDNNDQEITKDDRIMWSKQGAHDDFTLVRSKDVSTSDSGEITNLVTYGQYIYVVKNNAVYILDSMQNFRAVGTYNGVGSDFYGGALSTPYGVVVANSLKAALLPDNIDISETIRATYQGTTFSNPILSFNSKNNELRIVPDSSGQCFPMIYSFNDKSWSQLHKSADDHSNYLPTSSGSEFYVVELNNVQNIREVETDAEKSNSIATLHTKDFHFGDPSRKKYISDVFITYKYNDVGATDNLDFILYIEGFEIWRKSLSPSVNKVTKRVKINRDGRIFSFKIESPYGASDIIIEDIVIEGWHLDRH